MSFEGGFDAGAPDSAGIKKSGDTLAGGPCQGCPGVNSPGCCHASYELKIPAADGGSAPGLSLDPGHGG